MSSSEEKKKKITLMSSDREEFVVEEAVAMQMQTIKHIIEDDCATDTIPLPNVLGTTLSQVIEYAKNKAQNSTDNSNNDDAAIKAFETEFMKADMNSLFNLTLAANYLNFKALLDLCCQTVADRIKDKTPEEVRGVFNIVNDFTPEEEAKIKSENNWAFE